MIKTLDESESLSHRLQHGNYCQDLFLFTSLRWPQFLSCDWVVNFCQATGHSFLYPHLQAFAVCRKRSHTTNCVCHSRKASCSAQWPPQTQVLYPGDLLSAGSFLQRGSSLSHWQLKLCWWESSAVWEILRTESNSPLKKGAVWVLHSSPAQTSLWLTLQFSDLSVKVQIKESVLDLTFYFVLGFYKYTGFANVSSAVMPNDFTKK